MASSAPYLGPLAQYAGEDDAEENEAGPPDTLLALPGYIRARQAALKKAPLIKQRPSDPIKQFVAGTVPDWTAGAFGLSGMIGSAIEATSNVPEVVFDEETGTWKIPTDEIGHKAYDRRQKTWIDRYDEAAKEGVDTDLSQLGRDVQTAANKALGIKQPVSTEDRAARLLGNFLPISAAPLTKAVEPLGSLGNLLKGGGYVLTPLVQGGKGLGKRSAAQIALGYGLDYGISEATGMPALFSEEALAGVRKLPEQKEEEEPKKVAGAPDLGPLFTTVADDGPPKQIGNFLVGGPTLTAGPELSGRERDAILREYDEKSKRAEDWQDVKDLGYFIGTGLLTAAGAAYYLRTGKRGKGSQVAGTDKQTAGSYLHERHMDKASAIRDSLRSIGTNEHTISQVVSNAHTDSIGIARSWTRTGELGQAFTPPAGKRSYSPTLLRARFGKLKKDEQKLFEDAMGALAEKVARKGTKDDPAELWRTGRRPVTELDEIIAAADSNALVSKLMKDVHETYDVLLDYAVHRGVHTPGSQGTAAAFRAANTVDGRLAYVHVHDKSESSFMKKLSRILLGVHSTEARKASLLSVYGKKTDDVNFADDNKMSVFDSLERYGVAVIKDSNDQSYRGNILDKLAGIHREGFDAVAGIAGRVSRTKMDDAITDSPAARDTVYLGKATDLSDIDSLPFIPFTGDKASKKLVENFSGTVEDLKAKYPGDIITVHQGGEIRAYYVPDKGLKAALDLSPQITNSIVQAANHHKNVMTRFTTGNLSLFAPFSSTYSAQQTALNTFARDGVWRGLTSPFTSMAGVGRLFYANAIGDLSKYLANRIGVHAGIEGIPPTVLQKLQARFEDRFISSGITAAKTEAGRMAPTTYSQIGTGTMPEIMEGIVKGPIAKFFNNQHELALVVDFWNNLTTALHEGPAYGAYLRALGDEVRILEDAGKTISPAVMARLQRTAVDKAKEVSGDMRKVGASGTTQIFNQTFPFGSAMLQALNSMGAAARKHPVKFFSGAAALIGMPTVKEMLWNKHVHEASVDENGQPITFQDSHDPNKQWTYNDYLYNKYTTEQRTNNFIFLIPGWHPKDALLIPVSPEWSLYKGTVMDGMDTVFNFSDVGNIGMVEGVDREHWKAGLAKVTDIALPPWLNLLGSLTGADIQLGLAVEQKVDPEDPGSAVSVVRTNPFMRGERLTSRTGKGQFVDSYHERFFSQAIQDIFGAAGGQYLLINQAFQAGSNPKSGGTFERGLSMALDQSKTGAKSLMRYGQPLWGSSVRPKRWDEISTKVFTATKVLENLSTNFNNVLMSGGIVHADGEPVKGDAILRTVSDDPAFLIVAAAAGEILGKIKLIDPDIRRLEKHLKTIPTSAVGPGTPWKNIQDRNDEYDSIILRIQALDARKMAAIRGYEDKLEEQLTLRLVRRIDVDLTKFSSRPQVPAPGSLMKGLGLSRQISR